MQQDTRILIFFAFRLSDLFLPESPHASVISDCSQASKFVGERKIQPSSSSGLSLLAPVISCSSSISITPKCSRAIATVSSIPSRPIRSIFRSHQLAISNLYVAFQSGRVSSHILSCKVPAHSLPLFPSPRSQRIVQSLTMLRCQSPHHLFLFRFLHRCNPLRPTIPSSA